MTDPLFTLPASVATPLTGPARDYLDVDWLFTPGELALRDRVRAFVDERIRPDIARWYETATFPRELVKEMGALGLLGMHLHGYGCAGRSAVEYGLAAMELEAGDSGLRTFVSVQGSLAMSAIFKFGSQEQKARWLPGMAAGDLIGCFGLTEPAAGSDPASMATNAVRDQDGWVITGTKRWIGLASIADVAIIWANTDDGIRGFVVPTATEGFTATAIEPKLSMRASIQCDIVLDDVWLPADAVLPDATGLRGPFSCLNDARYGIMWGCWAPPATPTRPPCAMPWNAASSASRSRRSSSLSKSSSIWCWKSKRASSSPRTRGGSKDAGKLRPEQISFGKLNNVREAIKICRSACTILGGNGLTLEHPPLRHASNLEAVRTYEGTDEVHTLIMGRAITGIRAFS